jgi:hypothetical protein
MKTSYPETPLNGADRFVPFTLLVSRKQTDCASARSQACGVAQDRGFKHLVDRRQHAKRNTSQGSAFQILPSTSTRFTASLSRETDIQLPFNGYRCVV